MPLDLVVVPVRDGAKVTGIGVHAGLWTSEALTAPVDNVPVLRRTLNELEEEFRFDPRGHSGKALKHAVTALPRDLLVNLGRDAIRELVVTAMSLADRPRPTLVLVRSVLKGHLFAFVWLPRDELTTRRRIAIGAMLETEGKGTITNWSVELGDGDLAVIRYTLAVDPKTPTPDAIALDRRLDDMVRGWEPAVEEALGEKVGAARATRLAISYLEDFSESYRLRTRADDAAEDILRICELENAGASDARLYREEGDAPQRLRLKTYRLGELIPLSDAVPVLENFGFRVLEEQPTRWTTAGLATSTNSCSKRARAMPRPCWTAISWSSARSPTCCRARPRTTSSTSCSSPPVSTSAAWSCSAPGSAICARAACPIRLATVVEALRRAPRCHPRDHRFVRRAARPGQAGRPTDGRRSRRDRHPRRADGGRRRSTTIASCASSMPSYRPPCAPTPSRRRGQEALAFKLDSAMVPDLPAPLPWREIWVYSPRVEGIHLRGGPIARGGIRWSDRRDDFRTEILGLMKAQLVKNAVIVPTGAKGGFYPKQLPPAANRDAWLAEGTESYRIFIRALLSVTDNLVDGKVVHPEGVVIRDGDDPYFVVAADKGTATFSDIANAIAIERHFWLGDAFASGGSHGYDHKAMGITAKGAWVSVQRHFREMGVDVQTAADHRRRLSATCRATCSAMACCSPRR